MTEFKGRARLQGLVISAKRGQSYECNVEVENQPPIRVAIHKSLMLHIPNGGEYKINTLESGKITDNGSSLIYCFDPVTWADDHARNTAVDHLLSLIKGVISGL